MPKIFFVSSVSGVPMKRSFRICVSQFPRTPERIQERETLNLATTLNYKRLPCGKPLTGSVLSRSFLGRGRESCARIHPKKADDEE